MAATAHTSAPQTEPFPALDTTASAAAVASTATAGGDVSGLLRAPVSPKVDALTTTPFSKSEKTAFSPRTAPVALTGAAAMAELKSRKLQQQNQQQPGTSPKPATDSRQTTPNPAVEAMHALMGGGGFSKPSDTPATDKVSEPLRKAAEKMHVSESSAQRAAELHASTTSMTGFGQAESSGTSSSMTATAPDASSSSSSSSSSAAAAAAVAAAATATPQYVAEPAQMTNHTNYASSNGTLAADDQGDNKAFSYPPLPQTDMDPATGPARGMSLPDYGEDSPKSPAGGNKRHKCPFCSTEFTRHHNLKSHLLTHSQEKPYVCQTCQARFRRLHDLKRHTKLHTGERPHTCKQCGRRFARGDALARHHKGQGGCAGRRSSVGGEDDYGDPNSMDVDYTGADDDDGAADPNGRRISEPSRKRKMRETPDDMNRDVYRQHSNTYPPGPSHSVRGGMAPPTVVQHGPSNANSPRNSSRQPSPGVALNSSYYGSGQVFAEPGTMTSSPRPLSPGHAPDQHRLSAPSTSSPGQLGRNRSASLTTQFQQAHVGGRGSVGGRTPPPSSSQFAAINQSGPGLLPPIGASTSNQSTPRGSMPTSTLPGGLPPNMLHHPQGPGSHVSNPGSLSSHGRSSGSSMRDMVGQDPGDMWNFMRSLEQRFSRMQDEYELRISRLQEEVISLKGQMSNAASYSSEMAPRY